jgi:hypothetical protein
MLPLPCRRACDCDIHGLHGGIVAAQNAAQNDTDRSAVRHAGRYVLVGHLSHDS